MTPSAYVKPPQSGQPLPSGVTPRGGQPPRMPSVPQPPSMSTAGTPSKVTPLRRKPPGAAPLPNSGQPRRDRKSGRRRHRPAPRPVLYGIRLLILGTGIAAIAGTLLSTLNPANNTAVSNSPTGGVTTPAAERSSRSTATTLSAPLPLAEELAYLETELVALEAMTPGLTQSVFVYDLDTGNYVDLNGGNAVAAASTIKVPILVAFLEAVDAGTVQLDQAVVLREDLIGSGSGDFQTQEIGSRYTALDVATAMSVNSDNTATNMMIELLGGREVLNQRFREWGLQATVLRNPLPDLDGTNTTSPADLVRIMALVDQGQILSLRSRDRLFNILQRTVNRRLIPDGLADDQAVVYNKTGDIGTALGDIALVDAANGKRYVLAALVTRPFNDGRASELIRRIAGRIHQEMSQPTSPVGGAPAAAEPVPSEPGTPSQEEMPDGTYRETTPMPTSPEGSFDAPGEVPQG